VLKEIAFNYKLTEVPIRAEATKAVDSMSVPERLNFVGHNLIRRYGCFGCHNGIQDIGAKPEEGKKYGTFDRAQRIGADLDGWGVKLPARLDYAAWGHRPDGHSAVGHDRLSWATAKLTDTRRFDVLPSQKLGERGKHTYAVTNQLVQKTPEELLKMPLFRFAKNPEMVDAVVTFLAALTKDPIPLEMKHRLTDAEGQLAKGSRLIEELNCKGCHRIGAEPQFVNVARLPRFSLFPTNDEEERRNELEKETWLNATRRFQANPPPPGAQGPFGVEVRKGTLLRREVFDKTTTLYDKDTDEPLDELPVSVVELANGPVDSDSKIQGAFKVSGKPEADRILPVAGFQEGRIRFYYGSGVDDRPNAPPPLVRQGERVRADWLFTWLQDIKPIRPWLKVRMPSFYLTQKDARTLNDWFKINAGVPTAHESFEVDELDRSLAEEGKRLFGKEKGGLSCNSCHPRGDILPSVPQLDPADEFDYAEFQGAIPAEKFYVVWRDSSGKHELKSDFDDKESAQTWAEENLSGKRFAVGDPWSKIKWGPDLSKAAGRLRPPWARDWLHHPPDFMPGSAMPGFFGERDALRGIDLADEQKKNIKALLQYIVHMESMGEGVAKRAGAGE
jgi:cbb3-type cytochrome oxidase cytochrome c subunit